MGLPLVSLVTPVYNQAEYIAETILSVLSQTYLNIEYIVIDDGSTDDIDAAVAPYLERITFIKKLNSGQSDSLNIAWGKCSGQYLGYISADDRLMPIAVERMVREFSRSKVVAVYPDYYLIDSSGARFRSVQAKEYDESKLKFGLECLPGPGALFLQKTFSIVGGWDSKFMQCPDFEFWVRMAKEGDFYHVSEFLADLRIHEESSSVGVISEGRSDEIIVVAQEIIKDEPLEIAVKCLANAYIISSKHHAQSGRLLMSLCRFQKAISLSFVIGFSFKSLRSLLSGLFRGIYYRLLKIK